MKPITRPCIDLYQSFNESQRHSREDNASGCCQLFHAGCQVSALHPFDIATVSQDRVSKSFRITVETNRYAAPAHYAGQALTLKAHPDRLCIYHEHNLVVRHSRSRDRRRDSDHPDHSKPLPEQRKKAHDHRLFMCVLALSLWRTF